MGDEVKEEGENAPGALALFGESSSVSCRTVGCAASFCARAADAGVSRACCIMSWRMCAPEAEDVRLRAAGVDATESDRDLDDVAVAGEGPSE